MPTKLITGYSKVLVHFKAIFICYLLFTWTTTTMMLCANQHLLQLWMSELDTHTSAVVTLHCSPHTPPSIRRWMQKTGNTSSCNTFGSSQSLSLVKRHHLTAWDQWKIKTWPLWAEIKKWTNHFLHAQTQVGPPQHTAEDPSHWWHSLYKPCCHCSVLLLLLCIL